VFDDKEHEMSLKVIGAGVGRTGTYSLKLAINKLGFGLCHHMEEVIHNMPVQLPLWTNVVKGNPDWNAVYEGYSSAVDWPSARYFRELSKIYPSAKFILTHRDPERWVQSFSQTIYRLLAKKKSAPAQMQDWLDMSSEVIAQTGFPLGLNEDSLSEAFSAHNEAVKAAIPSSQLLVYQVKEGWEPLCRFLDVPVPDGKFPRTNDRGEFWDRVSGVS